jgi:hypothetical protein
MILILVSGAAAGQERPSTLDMSCADARALVATRNAVVLSTGGRNFDRYFASRVLCSVMNAEPEPRSVPTADDPSCAIGYICRPVQDD